jgi:hypothetical protein
MAQTNLTIPTLGNKFIDLRDPIPGDSYNWSWVRPLSQVNYLAIHHTAGPDTQTPNEIANFHINNNGWGGIGYHFLIGKNGEVYYVGDISTARANVANLNEQVLGICLIGNFTQGRVPTEAQLDSANKLCEFFINNYPDLVNVNSWDKVRGHKELPGQSTMCPGDNWPQWRIQIVEGVQPSPETPPTQPQPSSNRGAQISDLYRMILGRDPDMGGLQAYTNSPMTIEQILISMATSSEHRTLIENGKRVPELVSQINGLQTSLASINQQIITLRETLQEREAEIKSLKAQIVSTPVSPSMPPSPPVDNAPAVPAPDNTLTIVGALINLYKFLFPAKKVEQ